jgi:hypothetical protein
VLTFLSVFAGARGQTECPEESDDIKSVHDGAVASVIFENTLPAPVHVYWVDFEVTRLCGLSLASLASMSFMSVSLPFPS